MRRDWEPEELIACWTLVDDDWRLVSNKAGATRLGSSLILKFFELEGRFPRHAGDVPRAAVEYVAGQVKVDPNEFSRYDWSGRSIERHRAQIRKALGFREFTVGDEEKLAGWLAEEVCPVELGEERAAGGAAGPLLRRAAGAAGPKPDRPGAWQRPRRVRAAVLRRDRSAAGGVATGDHGPGGAGRRPSRRPC